MTKKSKKTKSSSGKKIKSRTSVVRDRATGFLLVNGRTYVCVRDGGTPLSSFSDAR